MSTVHGTLPPGEGLPFERGDLITLTRSGSGDGHPPQVGMVIEFRPADAHRGTTLRMHVDGEILDIVVVQRAGAENWGRSL